MVWPCSTDERETPNPHAVTPREIRFAILLRMFSILPYLRLPQYFLCLPSSELGAGDAPELKQAHMSSEIATLDIKAALRFKSAEREVTAITARLPEGLPV